MSDLVGNPEARFSRVEAQTRMVFEPESLSFETTERLIEPVREKTNNLGFQPGLTQTRLYSHRKELEA